MKLKTEVYKNLEITVNFWEVDNGFSANCLHLSSNNSVNKFTGNFKTYEEAVNNLKFKIDSFLKESPKTWDELTNAITNSLLSYSYEDYYADQDVIKILVSNFIKVNNNKLPI